MGFDKLFTAFDDFFIREGEQGRQNAFRKAWNLPSLDEVPRLKTRQYETETVKTKSEPKPVKKSKPKTKDIKLDSETQLVCDSLDYLLYMRWEMHSPEIRALFDEPPQGRWNQEALDNLRAKEKQTHHHSLVPNIYRRDIKLVSKTYRTKEDDSG